MNCHVVYYVSNPSGQLQASLDFVKAIVAGIEANYPRADKAGSWLLNHRILRDVPPPGEDGRSNHAHSYQHLLHLSSLDADCTYNLIQSSVQASQNGAKAPNLIVSIPLSQTDSHFALLVNQMPLLWSPQRVLDVVNGSTYQAGDFLIQVGELRSRRPGQTSNVNSPGVVVCISAFVGGSKPDTQDFSGSPGDDQAECQFTQGTIRQTWNTIKKDMVLGRSEVREFMQATSSIFESDQELAREAVVQMWCEALGPRA